MTLLFFFKPHWHLVGAGDQRPQMGFPATLGKEIPVTHLRSKKRKERKTLEALQEEVNELLEDTPNNLYDDKALKEVMQSLSSVKDELLEFKIGQAKAEKEKIDDLRKKIKLILLVMTMDEDEQ